MSGFVSIRSSSYEEEKRLFQKSRENSCSFQSAPPLTRRRNVCDYGNAFGIIWFQSAPPLTRRRNARAHGARGLDRFQSAPPLTRRRNGARVGVSHRPTVSIRSSSYEEEKLLSQAQASGAFAFQSAPPLTRRRNQIVDAVRSNHPCFNPLLLLRGGET